MKRTLVMLIAVGLVAGALVVPAEAKKAKPVATTLYAHGPSALGEIDGAQWAADGFSPTSPLTLDATAPTDSTPKSMNFFNPALNDECTGLPTGFPTFSANLSGTIVGDAHLTAYFVSAPATIKARIWGDMGAFTACNDAYVAPASEVDVDVPAGQNAVDITFPGLKLKATQSILVEILAPSGTDYKGQVGRLLYDSTASATSLKFNCIPASGTSCTG